MRKCLLMAVLVVGAMAVPAPAAAQNKPTIVVRFASVDAITAKGQYLAKLVDEADRFDLVVDFLKGFTGKGGVDGLDPKKPFGLYGKLGPAGIDSEVVVLAPIKDVAAFLAFLKKSNVPVEKQKDGLFKVDVPNSPFPGYLRFANGYAYFTLREEKTIDPANLPKPETILPPDRIGLMTAILDLEQIPDGLRALVLQSIADAERTEKGKIQGDGTEQQIQRAAQEFVFGQIRSIVKEGGPITLHLDANEAAKTLALTLGLAGKPGSGLAKSLADLGQAPSVAAGAIPGTSSIAATVNLTLPEKFRDLVVNEAEKAYKMLQAQEVDGALGKALTAYFEGFLPTLKGGTLDLGVGLVPSAGGKWNLVSALRLVQGGDLEKGFKALANVLPEEGRKQMQLKLDADKVGSVNIHSAVSDSLDANAKRLFGDGSMFAAIRADALLVSFGEGGLATMKKLVGSGTQPGAVASVRVNVPQVVGLLPPEIARVVGPAFKKVYPGNAPGRETAALTLQGGEELKLELSVPDTVLQLGSEIRKALGQ